MTALVDGRFLDRPHRFAVTARLEDGRTVEAHLGDPGRLRNLLRPGAALRLRPAPRTTRRSTRYTVALVRAGAPTRVWVSVETGRANLLAANLIARGRIRGLGSDPIVRREVVRGRSRFDFLLERTDGGRTWLEVKSVTEVRGGVALFPDAPTERGRRHLAELAEIRRGGDGAMVLFVVQRGDARRIRPHRAIDPAFARALRDARDAGVLTRGVGFSISRSGEATYRGAVPVGV